MKITVKIDGQSTQPATLPYPDAPFVRMYGEGHDACREEDGALVVRGGADSQMSHDAVEADAYCLQCRAKIGRIRAVFSTIFGIEEDARVLNGRCRVY